MTEIKRQNLEKHKTAVAMLKVLARSRKFHEKELMNAADLLTGYCTQGEKWDVGAVVLAEIEVVQAMKEFLIQNKKGHWCSATLENGKYVSRSCGVLTFYPPTEIQRIVPLP